ncbi:MAG: 2TM domain-containing protein, partial [Betaproteobacteria bacterium]
MTPENTTPDDPTLIRRAQRRVAMCMGFYTHVLVYAVVNGGLFVLNISQGGPLWSFWPMAGWGIG